MSSDFGSVESLVVAAIIEDGSPKKAFQAGITRDDFTMHSEEWDWIMQQIESGMALSWRRFQREFPDFEKVIPNERLQDLLVELKKESAYAQLVGGIETVAADLSPDNALERADQLREIVSEVLRIHSPMSDVLLSGDWKRHMEEIRRIRLLREQGVAPGIPTNIKSIDHHLGGLISGRTIVVLGRPGDAKSMTVAKFMVEAFWDNRRVGIFSPEMNEFEHQCRVATLLSAKKEIQEALGLKQAFRNRALMEGHDFNEKKYKAFRKWLDEQVGGEMFLFTQKFRRTKITPAFIESKVDDLGLEVILVDPIYKLKSSTRRKLKHEEIADLTDSMQDIAKMFNIPVLITNQAHRQGGNFRGSAPGKDSSFNSDAPVQEADHVLGVKFFEDENNLRIWCSKNRFGKPFIADIKFIPNIGVFEDTTEIKGSYFNSEGEYEESKEDAEIRKAVEEAERQEAEAGT